VPSPGSRCRKSETLAPGGGAPSRTREATGGSVTRGMWTARSCAAAGAAIANTASAPASDPAGARTRNLDP